MAAPVTPHDFAGPRKVGRFEELAAVVCTGRNGASAVLFDALREVGLELDPTRLHNLDVGRKVLVPGWYFPFLWINRGQHAAANALLMLAALEGGGRELWRWLSWAHAVSGHGMRLCGGAFDNSEARDHTTQAPIELVKVMRMLDERLAYAGFREPPIVPRTVEK